MNSTNTIRHLVGAARARRTQRILRSTTFCESCGGVSTAASRFDETRERLQSDSQARGFHRF